MFWSQEEMMIRASRRYHKRRNDQNEQMAGDPSRVNNHMMIGRHDGSFPPDRATHEELTGALGDLENSQTSYLIDRMGTVTRDARVLDAGCGRGGPAFMVFQRSGWIG